MKYRNRTSLVFLGNPKPLTEILFHKRKAISQFDLWFPSKQFLCICNVWFSLTRIVRSVLNHLYLHCWINKLQKHGHINKFFHPNSIFSPQGKHKVSFFFPTLLGYLHIAKHIHYPSHENMFIIRYQRIPWFKLLFKSCI